MKRKLKLGSVILLCAFTILLSALSTVSFSQNSDPLVTLSYLTDIILPQMKKDIIAEVSVNYKDEITESPDEYPVISPDKPDESDDTIENTPENNSTYTLLELEQGKTVYTNSTLEFIVRPGSEVQVVSPFENQGIADITNGKECLNGDVIELNAYCLIPRGSDGRGFKVVNEKSYILVRGEYYIG